MSEPRDADLPPGVALAWGLAAEPQRGPKRELSVERIVAAAIELADAGGLAAVSMAAVAASLGFTPMSLYRYVSAKDDLLLLMGDTAYGRPPEEVRAATGWRDGLQRWAHAQGVLYDRHPWLLDLPIMGTPVTPNSLAWLDAALQILDGEPLEPGEKLAVSLALIAQTRWRSTIERGYRAAAAATGSDEDGLDRAAQAMLDRLITAEQHPHVRRIVDAGAFGPGSGSGDPFAFGLDRVLDGVAVLLDSRR